MLNGRPVTSPGHTHACVRSQVKYTGCVVLAIYLERPAFHYQVMADITPALSVKHREPLNERM